MLVCSCSDDIFSHADNGISIGEVSITLTDAEFLEGITVELRNVSTNSIFTQTSDSNGRVLFKVTPGIYEATATGSRAVEGVAYTFNGTSGLLTVKTDETTDVSMAMMSARVSQIVIKELYNGGCLADDGTTKFQYDKCVILYNNSSQRAVVSNLCLGEAAPSNGQSQNRNYDDATGRLVYEKDGFIPLWHGIWYFPSTLEIEPYSQVVVNINGAIDNTQTISQSVNYANADYYCMYDPESGYNHTSYYPTPSSLIPTSHYLKAVELGQGTGWPLSVTSPALVLFQTKDISPKEYATNTSNQWYDGGEVSQIRVCVKAPSEWIVDAIEVFSSGYKDSSVKRLTSDVDAGYVWLTNYLGHSLYRNVNKQATEALPENEGLLVYQYSGGVDGSTDPSGIDAEASMRNGAHIIFQDTNNSSNDFHERQRCSLREQ
ncbi:MAG: DUF4876 domain-containing protein [Prevotella sp.]|nr:DUF4876 domain-containing protein [Prevotella sp.]